MAPHHKWKRFYAKELADTRQSHLSRVRCGFLYDMRCERDSSLCSGTVNNRIHYNKRRTHCPNNN